ncbi:MAG: hypothetical protein HFH32_15200 [Eubacterium sp.]|jgi:hypothetical protein|nr:hypothetical protein [Eubacterium sp.]
MIGIAFWNVHKNPDIDETIQNLILEKRCDMFILAEYENSTEGFCNLLSLKGKDFYPLHADEYEYISLASGIISGIESAEERIGHANTVIAGDFNANPFESMCINAGCFHGLPDAEEARDLLLCLFWNSVVLLEYV